MINLKPYFEYLLNGRKLSMNSINLYLHDITIFFKYINDKNISIYSVKKEDILNYIDFLIQKNKAPSTIGRSVASLRSYFSFLLSQNIIKQNPAKNVPKPKVETPKFNTLTENEIELLLSQPKTINFKGFRDKAMIEVMYATGLRVSELLNLNIEDLDIKNSTIICKNGEKERIIPLGAMAVYALTDYLENARSSHLIDNVNETALFVNNNGNRLTRQGFWKIIKTYSKKAKLNKKITPHAIRHSYASHLAKNGEKLSVIKNIMGHSSIAVTNLYKDNEK